MRIIGLTGNIASGKSKISEYLKTKGFKIIDADLIGKTILEDEFIKNRLVRVFGTEIMNKDGSIDRKKLGTIAFSSKENLEKLNRITLPLLSKKIKKKINEYKRKKTKLIVLDAAILIEAKWNKIVDEVWVVYTNPEVQLDRLIKRENYSIEEAKNRIDAQMDIDEKLKYADVIINNSFDWENTKQQVDVEVERLKSYETKLFKN
ncbi:MAG TPA: dephospho-CoA kinase [Caldisericia bacterium]|nr:dephospho-CoA kinase [Caldisericia bacterium]HPB34084.1 dephospho-CoA kinase [Caldisericia bacterium]HQL66867.1 dephospho-CoA kinase [Caldisericia bacterium]HQN48951.1 dephospho-CoA kinase [Caldisericia bacterium]